MSLMGSTVTSIINEWLLTVASNTNLRGHIDGAINYNNKELLAGELFEAALPGKTLLIFHCEYSAHRAPIMARFVRKQDRTVNVEHYPNLTYPEIYILDGGESALFLEHRNRWFF